MVIYCRGQQKWLMCPKQGIDLHVEEVDYTKSRGRFINRSLYLMYDCLFQTKYHIKILGRNLLCFKKNHPIKHDWKESWFCNRTLELKLTLGLQINKFDLQIDTSIWSFPFSDCYNEQKTAHFPDITSYILEFNKKLYYGGLKIPQFLDDTKIICKTISDRVRSNQSYAKAVDHPHPGTRCKC